MTTLIALMVAALVGDLILDLFGVHIESFQIAGGLIVLMIAFGMLKGEGAEGDETKTAIEQTAAAPKGNIAVYPLAIPLLAGPAAFVTTIVFSSRLEAIGDFVGLGTAILLIGIILWLAMAFATTAARFLNKIAISIGTKILGIFLASIAVEMILTGIDVHFAPMLSGG